MIVITDLTYETVPLNHHEYFEYAEARGVHSYALGPGVCDETVHKTIVQGRLFRKDNQHYIIGFKPEVAELLGMSFEAWENQTAQINEQYRRISDLHLEVMRQTEVLEYLRTASFWERLKGLFGGGRSPW